MTEHTLAVAVDRLHVSRWVAPDAHAAVQALVVAGCGGGNGEYDEPADTALRRMFDRNPIHEWDCVSVNCNAHFIIYHGLRIEFSLTPYIKRGVDKVEEHLERYLANRAKRTGIPWQVEKRYTGKPRTTRDTLWQRALIASANGERVRIYYRTHSRCWVVA